MTKVISKKGAVLVGLLACVPWTSVVAQQVPLPGTAIPQFVDPLPKLSVAGGTIKTIVASAPGALVQEIKLHMREFKSKMMPSTWVPVAGAYTGTYVWGYIDAQQAPWPPTAALETYTGPLIVATRGVPQQIRFVNDLGNASTTKVAAWVAGMDQTLHWADPLSGGVNGGANTCAHNARVFPGLPPGGSCGLHYSGPIPAVVHLHGGDVPPVLDGGPDAWFTSDGLHRGVSYYTNPNVPVAGNEAVYTYPNSQETGPIWFHDHALGITRLNVYAGLAGAYDIIDPSLQLPAGLHPLGLQQGTAGAVDYLTPLVIQDRMFDTNGQLYMPNVGLNPEHPFWVPEFVGDTIAVNGKVWPYMDVRARRYRFLIINGSSARTYELGISNQARNPQGPAIWQIGTDGGYLDAPVGILTGRRLVLMPGERADIIVDFAAYAGQTLVLTNTAKMPYPAGRPADPQTVGRIVQFRVAAGVVADTSYNPATLTPIRTGQPAAHKPIVRLVNPLLGTVPAGVAIAKTRQLTLNENLGPGGPLEMFLNNAMWDTATSEVLTEGTTEVWEIVNLTADAHPIHTHLAQCQILNRQNFDLGKYTKVYAAACAAAGVLPGMGPPLNYLTGNPRALGGNPDITPFLKGAAAPPAANEAGWKDTMLAMPSQVTRFVIRLAPQEKEVNSLTPWYPFDPAALGRSYVWHCHIIDHEDNEMMRRLGVIPYAPAPVRSFVQGVDY